MNNHHHCFDQASNHQANVKTVAAVLDRHCRYYHDQSNTSNDETSSSTTMTTSGSRNESIVTSSSSSCFAWCWKNDDDDDDDNHNHDEQKEQQEYDDTAASMPTARSKKSTTNNITNVSSTLLSAIADASTNDRSNDMMTTTTTTMKKQQQKQHQQQGTMNRQQYDAEDEKVDHTTTKRQRHDNNNNKEVFIVAIGTAQRGKEYELIERIKERQRKALNQQECRYCDILTSTPTKKGGGNAHLLPTTKNHNIDRTKSTACSSVDESKSSDNASNFKHNNSDDNNATDAADTTTTTDEMQIVTVSYWNDVNAFRRYLVLQSQPQKEFQTCCYEKKLAHASKFSIEQYQPLNNPFLNYAMSSAATEARGKCWPPLHHPLDRATSEESATFAILIELSSSIEEQSAKFLRQYIYTSQTCSRFEPGCLRYEVFEPWHEEDKGERDNNKQDDGKQQCYLVYALFASRQHYMDHKHNQGYSLVNRYTIHTFKSMNIPMPVITTFYKTSTS